MINFFSNKQINQGLIFQILIGLVMRNLELEIKSKRKAKQCFPIFFLWMQLLQQTFKRFSENILRMINDFIFFLIFGYSCIYMHNQTSLKLMQIVWKTINYATSTKSNFYCYIFLHELLNIRRFQISCKQTLILIDTNKN